MNKVNSNIASVLITILLIVVVVMSSLVTSHIVSQFEEEEQKKIELWAEATRQFILATENDNIDLLLQVMEGNTTIPVYMVDTNYNLLLSRNVRVPKRNVEEFYVRKINELRAFQEPIEVRISENVMQYIYYEQSSTLRWLSYFPYIQLIVMLALAALAAIALLMVQRSEKNSLWVGLSKETAHQLGTPISSLLAWIEILKQQYPDDMMIPEMSKDINRLRTIADRFSQIGSKAELELTEVNEVVQRTVAYMRKRISRQIDLKFEATGTYYAMMNVPLFEWVIENLCRNATDAIEDEGEIRLFLTAKDAWIYIDVIDNGKGIAKQNLSKVFRPGFTTKKRGWGLGLSLVYRIIHEYHKGRIYVRNSEVNVGTTFRIELQKA
jgi:signal transduction histidine kinase